MDFANTRDQTCGTHVTTIICRYVFSVYFPLIHFNKSNIYQQYIYSIVSVCRYTETILQVYRNYTATILQILRMFRPEKGVLKLDLIRYDKIELRTGTRPIPTRHT